MQASDQQRKSYSDFEIEVGRGSVSARSQLTGEARAPFSNPYNDAERNDIQQWLQQALTITRGISGGSLRDLNMMTPQQLGTKLFEALFPPPILSLYERSRSIATDRRLGGIRLKLRLLDDVAHLPWELLYNPSDDYLALTPRISLVRYLEAAVPIQSLSVSGPLRLLLVGGAAEDLDLAKEIDNVKSALDPLVSSQSIAVDVLTDATLEAIYAAVSSHPIHIVHYIGHSEAPTADSPAQLMLSDGAGNMVPTDINNLWRILRRAEQLRLIWLNSCNSATSHTTALVGPLASAAARFVTTGVPAVIANQIRISDKAAITVSQAFYTNLSKGLPVDVALSEARVKVSLSALNSLEWATPVLYMRAPDGVIFEQASSASEQTGATDTTQTSTSTQTGGINFGTGTKINNMTIGDIVGGDKITIGDISHSSGIAIGRGAQANIGASSQSDAEESLEETLKKTLLEKRRRLAQRELQAARYGINTPPEISIEIEDLKREITALQRQIGTS